MLLFHFVCFFIFFPYNRTVQICGSWVTEDVEQNKVPDKTKNVSKITANLVLVFNVLLFKEFCFIVIY